MKVSLYGNALNLGFLLGLFLRRKGHDVTVFVDAGAAEYFRPEWECMDQGEAAAVQVIPVNVDPKRLLLGGSRERNFRSRLAQADIVQTFGEGVIWSAGCGAPDTVLSIGDDLDILPFRTDSLRIRVYGKMLRRAQHRCCAVCYTVPHQIEVCEALGLTNSRFLRCAIPIDTDRWSPIDRGARRTVRAQLGISDDAVMVFQPSRQEWTRTHEELGTAHKGNDRFLRGFAQFAGERGRNAVLVAVDKGRDVQASRDLVSELGIGNRVHWIQPQNKSGLREITGASDAVADQFTAGYFGISTLEAMSVGRPVLNFFDPAMVEKIGADPPPGLSGWSPEEISAALSILADDREKSAEIGASSREWIVRNHGWEPVVDRYLALYQELHAAFA